MQLPLRRDSRRKATAVIPVLGGLALNILLYAGLVYPMSVRVRSTEARAQASQQALRAAERDDAAARGVRSGTRADGRRAKGVLQGCAADQLARRGRCTFLRLTQLAEAHNLQQSRRSTDPEQERTVARADAHHHVAAGKLRGHSPLHLSGRIGDRLHRDRQRRPAPGRRVRRAADARSHPVDLLPCEARWSLSGSARSRLASLVVALLATAVWRMQSARFRQRPACRQRLEPSAAQRGASRRGTSARGRGRPCRARGKAAGTGSAPRNPFRFKPPAAAPPVTAAVPSTPVGATAGRAAGTAAHHAASSSA